MHIKQPDLVTETAEGLDKSNPINQTQTINPQVKAVGKKRVRRKFSKADKLKLIKRFDGCEKRSERGAFLRKNGLYYSSITKWKRELEGNTARHGNSKAYQVMLKNKQLQREVTSLKKQLAQAEAVIDIQKKVSQLLSMNVLEDEESETQS